MLAVGKILSRAGFLTHYKFEKGLFIAVRKNSSRYKDYQEITRKAWGRAVGCGEGSKWMRVLFEEPNTHICSWIRIKEKSRMTPVLA